MSEDEFVPRPAFTIDWLRQYDCGPSDAHLHAIGQFIANYSCVEWQLSGLFGHFLGIDEAERYQLISDGNISMAGMTRFVLTKLTEIASTYPASAKEMQSALRKFEALSKVRHRIVHWQWGLGGSNAATQSNLIRPRKGSADAILELTDLRNHCLELMKIFESLNLNFLVISGQCSRNEILAMRKSSR